jgi:nucleoside-diphosphate-sugar epimerase
MSSIIITGANGNLGLAVVNRLLKDGYQLQAAVGNSGTGSLPANKNFEASEVDLMNEAEAKAFVEKSLKKHTDIKAAVLLVGGFAI